MTKPVITTRAGKGSALTWTEGDTNLTNLRDATVTIKADTGGTDVVSDLNGTVTLVAGSNVTITGDNTAKTVTIAAAGASLALDDLTDVSATSPMSGDTLVWNNASSVWQAQAPSAGSMALDDLTDVNVMTASDGQVLTYNQSLVRWEATTPSSGGATTLDGLSDVSVPTPSPGHILYYDGSGWVGGFAFMSDLNDVNISTLTSGDLLQYNGTAWVDVAPSTLTVGTASVGSTVTLTADDTTNATNYPLFANAATGNLSPRTDTGFTYNPSTGVLTATSFIGNVNISTNTGNSADTTLYPVMVATSSTGAQALHIDSTNYQFDATNNVLSVGAAGDASASIKLFSTGTQSVSLKAPSSLNTPLTFTLPGTTGTSGQVLSTNGSGTLSWVTASSGGASIALLSSTVATPYALTVPATNTTIAAAWAESTDPSGIVTVSGNTFTLGAGTYIIEYDSDTSYWSSTSNTNSVMSQSPNWILYLYNTTDSATVAQWAGLKSDAWVNASGDVKGGTWQPRIVAKITLAGSKTFDFRYDSFSGSGNSARTIRAWYSQAATVKITKTA